MKREEIERQFIDLVEGRLSPEQEQELRGAIERDEELRVSFRAYERTISVEEQLRGIADDPGNDFVSAVMDRVRHEGDPVGQQDSGRRWSMWYQKYRRQVAGLIGAGGVVSLGLMIRGGEVEDRGRESAPQVVADTRRAESYAPINGESGLVARFSDELTQLPAQNDEAHRRNENLTKRPQQYEQKTGTIFKKMIEKKQASAEEARGAPASKDLMAPVGPRPWAATAASVGVAYEDWALNAPPSAATPFGRSGRLRDDFSELRASTPRAAQDTGFTQSVSAPHSTFSLDVDTGSYTNARKAIRQGYRPPPQTVRAEEFINYFRYSHPTPSEQPLGTHYELAPSPITKGAKILSVAVSTKAASERDRPWNLVFLIDTSGSMSDRNKLPLVKNALKVLAAKMRPTDRLSIVTYADGARVALEPSGMSEKAHIDGVIDGLSAGGGTNGGAGLSLAYDKAQSAFIPGGVNRVVLATDGDFNVGVTNQADLISQIEHQRTKHISLTTLGVGEANYKEQLMEQLADKGDGNYFYLDGFSEAQKIFGEDLFSTIETVAKDVKIQVEFNPARVASYRLIGYQNRALAPEQFRDDSVDAGEVGAGHRVTALYEIVLVGDETPIPAFVEHRYGPTPAPTVAVTPSGPLSQELGFVRIRFKKPESNTSEQLSFPLSADRLQSSLGAASNDLRFATAVGAFAERLAGDAAMPFEEIISLAESARGDDPDGKRTEFIGLVREVMAMPSERRIESALGD